MAQDASDVDTSAAMADLLNRAGITVTDEGRERGRRTLADARDRLTPEVLDGIRRQVGRAA